MAQEAAENISRIAASRADERLQLRRKRLWVVRVVGAGVLERFLPFGGFSRGGNRGIRIAGGERRVGIGAVETADAIKRFDRADVLAGEPPPSCASPDKFCRSTGEPRPSRPASATCYPATTAATSRESGSLAAESSTGEAVHRESAARLVRQRSACERSVAWKLACCNAAP